MPRGKKTTVLQVELPENGSETEAATEETTEADKVISEDQSENPRSPYKVVERIDQFGGEAAWLGKFPVPVVTREWIAKRFGGGEYRVTTRKPKPTGGYQYVQQQTIKIDASIKPELTVHDGPIPERSASPFGSGDSFVEKMLLMQMDTSAKLMASITSAFGNMNRAPSNDNAVLLAVVTGMMGKKDPTEIAGELIRAMKESGGMQKDPITQLKEVLELKELLGGDGGAGDPETAMIMKGMETLQSLFAGGRAFAPSPGVVPVAAPHAALPAPVPQPPKVEAPPVIPVDPTMRAWKRGVAQNLPMLLQAAAFMPPHAAAETAQEQMRLSETWADLVEDVKSDYPNLDPENLPVDFGQAFVDRTAKDLHLASLTDDQREWAREVLFNLAEAAVEPEEEEKDDDAS